MVKKSKLLGALDAHKGRDYEAEKRKKQVKAAVKRKREQAQNAEESQQDDSENEEETPTIKVKKVKTSTKAKTAPATVLAKKDGGTGEASSQSDVEGGDSDEDDEDGSIIPQPVTNADASASEAEQDSDVPLSELEDEDMEDMIPHQRLTINNGPALLASQKRVTIAKPKMPFHIHNSLVSSLPPSSEVISDPNDDLTRELEFYRIARDAVVTARSKLKAENVPFTRPSDYFAEMVKSEDHMGKVKKRLYDEAAGKKASEEARKLRDAKKFGKAVQVAKEQERAKEKRSTLDKIKELKRKRKGQPSTNTTESDNLFQEIAVENEAASTKRSFSSGGPNPAKRQRRDAKFGFGGKKRFSKSGDAMSSADMSGFSAKGMKGKGGIEKGRRPTTKRLGKSRRVGGRP